MRIDYPAQLPIAARVPQIRELIREHQVVILAGETGSGKTTQLPKICLEVGRPGGRIGHTQPRRLAARAVASRLAEETGTTLGEEVGYAVRFGDRVSRRTQLKVMTDGILLAEIGRDRKLSQYDTLIIDEAHERSLTIDFLLGYLKRLLPQRPDLKLVVTSATIDVDSFSRHFDGAPIVEVSGRTYPVEVRYRPFGAIHDPPDRERDQVAAIRDAVAELCREGPGDILVFLSGEREISDAAEALRGFRPGEGPMGTGGFGGPIDVVPLYARLSTADQQRIFAAHQGRRVILSTNIAETSLTVPGIRYVVDAGTARISRFSPRTKVQALPIEPISRASAQQRAGRCGRVADGVCIRLYSEADYLSRPQYTDPEILRTNLAAVLLRMADLDLGDVASFPFPNPPDSRHVTSGEQLLVELGALQKQPQGNRITSLGRRLNRLPVDPRIGRMILAAQSEGAVSEVLPIAAALSIADPRERPADKQQVARQSHARFAETGSDFLALLNLWRYIGERQRALSGSAFRRMCRAEFLHYLRIREWQDLHGQLQRAAAEVGISDPQRQQSGGEGQSADADAIHRSIVAGLLSHVGLWDERQRSYAGGRGIRFVLSPGSSLVRKPPDWVMAAEIVTTSRPYAHTAAAIDPGWLEDIGSHLVVRQHSEPRWSRRRGSAVATEKVLLYGLPIVVDRTVPLSRHDPAAAREMFIRHALVGGEWVTRHRFVTRNRVAVERVRQEEDRLRRRGIVADEEDLVAFFEALIPASVVSARHFDTWWKTESRRDPHLLDYPAEVLRRTVGEGAGPADTDAAATRGSYPLAWLIEGQEFALSYRFEPGSDDDGVTVDIALSRLPATDPARLRWGVPGMRAELITALLRSLPKLHRRRLVPIPDTAARVAGRLRGPEDGAADDLAEAIIRDLRQHEGVSLEPGDLDIAAVPAHLRPRYRIIDDRPGQPSAPAARRVLAEGRDLRQLQERFEPLWRDLATQAAAQWERERVSEWDFGDLPDRVEASGPSGGAPLVVHPALVARGGAVSLRGLPTAEAAAAEHRRGVVELVLLRLADPLPGLRRSLSTEQRLGLAASPYRNVDALLADAVRAVLDESLSSRAVPRTAGQFTAWSEDVGARVHAEALRVAAATAQALLLDHAVAEALATLTAGNVAPIRADIEMQRAALLFDGFIRRHGTSHVLELPRYLRAILHRIAAVPGNVGRDALAMEQVRDLEEELTASVGYPTRRPDLFWMVQELRVSLFAQPIGARGPVSVQRIRRAAGTTGV